MAAPRDKTTMGPPPFWTKPLAAAFAELASSAQGISADEAAARLRSHGPNSDAAPRRATLVWAVARRFLEPLILVLLFAAGVSAATGDMASAAIIVVIIIVSVGLDAVQEGRAARAAEVLKQSVALSAEVLRGGKYLTVSATEVVPGDVFRTRTGDIIPADALVIDVSSFTANEAAMTGEPYPVEKRPGIVTSSSAADATNALFRGSVAQTGEAVALAVATGRNTVFGAVASVLAEDAAPSPFQRDLRALGFLVARAAGVLSLAVLAVNLLFGRPLVQSLMFAVALAVGLTPELLPMITTVTLSRGAVRMARRKVIVKRLASIHDLGAMTVLCTDKTGTLTSAEIVLAGSLNARGKDDPRVAALAGVCAELAGDRGAMDGALAAAAPNASDGWTAEGRIGFSYERRRGSVLARGPDERLLICKGAPEAILAICDRWRDGQGTLALDGAARDAIGAELRRLAAQGLRAVAVGTKPRAMAMGTAPGTMAVATGPGTMAVATGPGAVVMATEPGAITTETKPGAIAMAMESSAMATQHRQTAGDALKPEDEAGLVFEGFCTFADPPKATAGDALKRLAAAGVRVKVLSGDDPLVVARIAGLVGLDTASVLAGPDLAGLSEDAFRARVQDVDLYGRLTPDQKVRVVRALQARGETVGFLGDGVNDAPGIRVADIGLSVDGATGVARAAADMILLAPDLNVVADGVEEGRRTFANVLKYVRMGSSSNFGNMLSMAAASLFLPFLPLLATQILLNNLLYDLSEVGIPFDTVDAADIARPQHWNMRGIVRYAAVMGPLSSVFDGATFLVLLVGFHVAAPEFRTAWFLESIATQILVVFVIRTRAAPWRSLPDRRLLLSALCALVVAMIVPFVVVGQWFDFAAPGLAVLAAMGAITVAYLVSAELLKGVAVRS